MLGFLIILGSILLGIISSVFIYRLLTTKIENKSKLSNDTKFELDKPVFEKDITLEALDKINYFIEEKKIDIHEKDKLLLKYSKLLEHYNVQIFKLQPTVELQEIYEYHKKIFSLISDSIAKLDNRLSNFPNYIREEKEGENRNIDKKEVKIKNESELHSIPLSQSINHGKLDGLHKYIDSLNPFSESKKKGMNVLHAAEEDDSMTFSAIVNNHANENDTKNCNNKNNREKKNISIITEDSSGDFDLDEINKIQKDILNILQRLESTSVKV
jgi:hypothetical protein